MPITEHRLIDSTKRALVKYVFTAIDGTQSANTVLVDASTLAYALNISGNIMVANAAPRPFYRSAIKRIYAAVKTGGSIVLSWQGANNFPIVAFGSGEYNLNFDSLGDGAVLTNNEVNPSGDILISSTGLALGDAYTLIIDIRKDNRDYDAGQTADPLAFNKPGIP